MAERQTDGHQPLLRTVVQVSLDAPALLVRHRRDPRP